MEKYFKLIKKLQQDRHLAVILAGGFGAIALTRDLGRHKIPTIVLGQQEYVTKSKYCLGINMADTSEMMEFLIQLPHYVDKTPVLFTDNEVGLDLLYKNWSLLKKYYKAPFNPGNICLNNKFLLAQMAEACGLKVPETYENIAAVKEYPVLVKPLNGLAHNNQFIKKAYQCSQRKELEQVIQLLNRHHTRAVIQQIIPGDTQDLYSVILYRNSQGKIFIGGLTRKIREYPSRHGTGTSCITCNLPEIVSYSIQLLNNSNYNGVAEIEYKYNHETKDYYIIEVNGRFPLQTGIVHKSGSQFIYRIYLDLIAESETNIYLEKTPDKKNIMWSFLLKDLLTAKSIPSLISEYCSYGCHGRIQWAVWDRYDFKPFLYYNKYLWCRLINNFLKNKKRNKELRRLL